MFKASCVFKTLISYHILYTIYMLQPCATTEASLDAQLYGAISQGDARCAVRVLENSSSSR
jgi:hypothetical protein